MSDNLRELLQRRQEAMGATLDQTGV